MYVKRFFKPALVLISCFALSGLFAQTITIPVSSNNVKHQKYLYPVYLGVSSVTADPRGGIEYTITERTEARAKTLADKVVRFYSMSAIRMDGSSNRIMARDFKKSNKAGINAWMYVSGAKETPDMIEIISFNQKIVKVNLMPYNNQALVDQLFK